MAKPKKEIKEEEVIEAPQEKVIPPAANIELLQLLTIHNAMSLKGIRDIGQLEVLISRLQ